MSKVIGKLMQVVRPGGTGNAELGSVEFALCGYGTSIPRTNAPMSQFALITQAVQVQQDGTFNVTLAGNDVIDPPHTYYTYTVKDANGDIVQTAAYIFADGTDYDLDWGTTPFDPSLGTPPSPVPPAITSQLLTVGYSSVPEFPGDVYASWQITLTGDAAPIFFNLIDGNLYTIRVIQDGAGGRAFTWPSNVDNAATVDPDPNSTTLQTFMAVSDTLYAIAPATYYP